MEREGGFEAKGEKKRGIWIMVWEGRWVKLKGKREKY